MDINHLHYKNIFGTTARIFSNIFHLVFSLPFIVLSFLGNSVISAFAIVIYYIERDVNDKINSVIDAFWWSFATATTVGYGDITPKTMEGKLLGIFLMLVGTALFATYTALFARAIIGDDFKIKALRSKLKPQDHSKTNNPS